MDANRFNFFRTNGFLNLGQVLTPVETATTLAAFDTNRLQHPECWQPRPGSVDFSCDALATIPDIDGIIRHPAIFPIISELFGVPVCFSEISLRMLGPHSGPPQQSWHRDKPPYYDHPLRMEYMQLMIYLTDVNESTHCFSISPESVNESILDTEEQLTQRGTADLHGPAGTAVLFNVSCLHTATFRPTGDTRKSIQIYYGHREGKVLSNFSLVPPAFWRDSPDQETRDFYGLLNQRSQDFRG